MWYVVHLVAAPAGFLFGLFCVLTAIVLYPDEEGKIQSKFEDFWIRVDDYQNLALSRHAAFMTGVAKLETRFLDRVFGHRLVSVQAVEVSFCCSFGSVSLLMWLVFVGLIAAYVQEHRAEFILIGLRSILGWLICALIVGIAGILIQHRWTANLSVVIAALIFLFGWTAKYSLGTVTAIAKVGASTLPSLLLFVLVSFACDVVFIGFTRWLLRWAGIMTSSLKVVIAVVLNLMLAAILVSPLFWVVPQIEVTNRFRRLAVQFMTAISLGNAFDLVLSLVFALLALSLLIHRASWPLLSRTLFKMQDIGTIGRRVLLIGVGLALLGWSGAKLPALVKELVKALGKG